MTKRKIALLSLAAGFALASAPGRAETPAPEAEPMDYVRACDAFGAGYFYIPGTDTCLQIGGLVRSELYGGDNVYARTAGERHRDTYAWLTRGALTFATASLTDWGTLRSFMSLRSDWQAGADFGSANDRTSGSLRQGYIELGGLRVGLDETAFTAWVNDYGNVLNDDVLNGSAGRTNLISYTYSSRQGFSAILSLEQGNNFDGDGNPIYVNEDDFGQGKESVDKGGYRYRSDGTRRFQRLSQQTHDFMPYIVTGLKYEQPIGSVSGVFGWDSYYSEWAAKLRLDANLTPKISAFFMAGYKSMEDWYNLDTSYGNNGVKTITRPDGSQYKRYGTFRQINSMYGDWGGDWAFWTGASYKHSKQTSFNIQLAYSEERSFMTGANIKHTLLPGLTLLPEITFMSWNNRYGHHFANGNVSQVSLKGKTATQAMLRLQRAF